MTFFLPGPSGALFTGRIYGVDLSRPLDNGRIVGYDNAHGQHHRHYFGRVDRVDRVEFESYEKLEGQFEAQVRQYLETGTCEAGSAHSGRR